MPRGGPAAPFFPCHGRRAYRPAAKNATLHARQEPTIPKPEGNVQGLKPSQLTALNRLFNRRFPAEDVYTVEQARELALLSRAVGRQVGLLIDRKGRVQMVIVGCLLYTSRCV